MRDRDALPPDRRFTERNRRTRRAQIEILIILLVIGVPMIILFLFGEEIVRSRGSRRPIEMNNLKQLAVAMHEQNDVTHQVANGPYATDPKNEPNAALSFRVDLLPYLEYESLGKKFRKDEAWDSQVNRPLADSLVKPLSSPLDPAGTTTTRYRGFVGPESVFEPGNKVTLASITDGTANTIYMVAADDGVIWSQPEELNYTPNGPLPTIGRKAFTNGTNISMCDGTVRYLSNKTSEPVLRALITRNGGESLPSEW